MPREYSLFATIGRMGELHGVLFGGHTLTRERLKQQVVLFDAFHVVPPHERWMPPGPSPEVALDLEFLRSQGVVRDLREELHWEIGMRLAMTHLPSADLARIVTDGDMIARLFAGALSAQEPHIDIVHIANEQPRSPIPEILQAFDLSSTVKATLKVALAALPVPDETCSWMDILDFKTDLREKQWGFRRFLKTLATKVQTEAEIGDEIEWLVTQYSKAMEIHQLRASRTFLEAYVIPTVEVLEDIVKLNWSKIAKSGVAAKQRRIDLLDAELKAPGRECAYVFDARKRFRSSKSTG
jgi:hypothetical protein